MKLFRTFPYLAAACLMAQTPAPPAKPKPAATAKPKPAAAKPAAAKPAATSAAKPKPAAPAKPSAASPGDKVVITIGEEKITASEFDSILSALPDQYRASAASGPGKKQFIDNLVRVKVLAQEGRRRKLDQDPAFQARIALQREELLAANVYNNLTQGAGVTDAQVSEYYQAHKNEFETVRARHILIRFKGSPAPVRPGEKDLTEEEALAKVQALRKEIAGGADFGEVAKRESDDGGSGVSGGDLGTFSRGRMVPTFEEVAFKQPVGEVSEPVKTMFGYHLIKVEQRESKTFDQAKADIEKKLRPEAAARAVDSIQKNTNIVIDPEFLGEPKPADAAKPAEMAKPAGEKK